MCRIESSHADLQHYRKFAQAAFLDASTHIWNAPVFLTRLNPEAQPGDSVEMVAYIAQPGKTLPAF
jgi:hypothetical protein